ncbi:MAG: porin family protein [Planctomycetota bacterium]|nr:MAG: porin family protein [Planctomycetota bacterium]
MSKKFLLFSFLIYFILFSLQASATPGYLHLVGQDSFVQKMESLFEEKETPPAPPAVGRRFFRRGLYGGIGFSFIEADVHERDLRDDIGNIANPGNYPKYDFGEGFGIQLKAGFHLNSLLAVETQFDFLTKMNESAKDVSNLTRSDFVSLVAMFGARASFPLGRRLRVYGYFGLGFVQLDYFERTTDTSGNILYEIDSWEYDFAVRFSMGAEYFLIRRLAFYLDIAYTKGVGEVEGFGYFATTFGAILHL